jgi:2-polyprenyl-3-methyl-5-hydroxy-6-metoxy-1,4-benzoquinol methylase
MIRVRHRLRRASIDAVRGGLRRLAARRSARRYLEVAIGELSASVKDTVDEARYGSAYFGRSRPKHTASGGVISGYARYDRRSSNLDIAAYLVWRFLPHGRILDVGAALGFLVEAFRDLGLDAIGIEYSEDAVRNAAPGALGHLLQGDVLEGLPLRDAYADVVTCLETLEHLPPDAIPAVAAELRRVCRCYLFVTTPSIGPNPNGPDGFLEGKVRDAVLDAYYTKGRDYSGPVPYDDLYRDADGNPVEGHLTVASYAWWTERFEEAGFIRCGDTERRIHPEIRRYGMATLWNLYVFRVPEVAEPPAERHEAHEARRVERLFALRERVQPPAPPTRWPLPADHD